MGWAGGKHCSKISIWDRSRSPSGLSVQSLLKKLCPRTLAAFLFNCDLQKNQWCWLNLADFCGLFEQLWFLFLTHLEEHLTFSSSSWRACPMWFCRQVTRCVWQRWWWWPCQREQFRALMPISTVATITGSVTSFLPWLIVAESFVIYLPLKGNGVWSQISLVIIFNVSQGLISFGSHLTFAINTLPVSGWLLQQHNCVLGSKVE